MQPRGIEGRQNSTVRDQEMKKRGVGVESESVLNMRSNESQVDWTNAIKQSF